MTTNFSWLYLFCVSVLSVDSVVMSAVIMTLLGFRRVTIYDVAIHVVIIVLLLVTRIVRDNLVWLFDTMVWLATTVVLLSVTVTLPVVATVLFVVARIISDVKCVLLEYLWIRSIAFLLCVVFSAVLNCRNTVWSWLTDV